MAELKIPLEPRVSLRYIGDGSFLPGIPARDLLTREVAVHGKNWLLSSGLYAEVEPPVSKVEEDQHEDTQSDKGKRTRRSKRASRDSD